MPQFDDTKTQSKIDELHVREEEQLTQTLAPQYGFRYARLTSMPIEVPALKLLEEDIARHAEVALFAQKDKELSLAVKNPKDPQLEVITELLTQRGFTVIPHLVTRRSLEHAWTYYATPDALKAQKQGTLDIEPSVIKGFADTIHLPTDVGDKVASVLAEHSPHQTSSLMAAIFGGALSLGASDIHIEPEAHVMRVRYRLDGVLRDICDIETAQAKNIVSRLKVLAGVKLNVRKEAQDGRFTFDIGTRAVEVRTSVIPGAYGESLVMRLLDPNAETFSIEKLGLNARMLEVVREELKRPTGAIITTGPTGSGKTTALYSFLTSVHTPDIKVVTLEDPIEYKLDGIVQTQVGRDYTFASGLRTILRQDPDVILVGEIRDSEVADTAMQAALTGHLVFSTLHTNSAAASFARLSSMGVDMRTVGSACNLILGQRLVRTLCDCKVEHELTTEEQKLMQRILEQPLAIHSVFAPKGCDKCGGSGYKGRIGVFEAILLDEKVEEVILMDTRESAILEAAKPQNIPTMQQDALMKVLAGITSLDEVARVIDLHN